MKVNLFSVLQNFNLNGRINEYVENTKSSTHGKFTDPFNWWCSSVQGV